MAKLVETLILLTSISKVSSFFIPITTPVTFPLSEFYDTTDEEFLQQQEKHLCIEDLPFSRSGCCICVDICLRYKSCCVNYLWKKQNYTDVKAYKEMLGDLSKTRRNQACAKTFPTVTNFTFQVAWNYMINKCSLSNKVYDENRILCEQNASSTLLPVIGNDGYLYRNPYCSACNGIDLFEMIPVTIKCGVYGKKCDIKTDLPRKISMPCTSFKQISCDKYDDLCSGFVGPYNGYRNYFCYLCKKESSNETIPRIKTRVCQGLSGFKPLRWSALFQFSNPTDRKKCKDDKVSDILGSCVNYHCPPGYTSRNFRCMKNEALLNMTSLSFDECFFFRNLSIFIEKDDDENNIHRYFAEYFESRITQNPSGHTETILLQHGHLQNYLTIPKIDELNNMVREKSFVHIAEKRNMSLPWLDHPFVYRHDISCLDKIVLDENTKYTPDCNAITKESIIPKWNLFMSMNITKGKTKRSVYACKTYYNGCPLQVLHSNVSLENNGTLIHQSKGIKRIYGIKEYTLISENVYGVCIDTEKITLPSWYATVQVVEGYISVTGSLLSIISYIIVLLTFYFFEKPFNLPTRCVMALCTSLFCADSLFLAINVLHFFELEKIALLCDLIGSINHFFLISGQLWCVIMAINLFISLKSINTLDSPSIRYRFIKYCLIVFVISLIMVLLAIVLREAKVFDNEFERKNVCFFGGGFYTRMVLHALPLIISFVTSIIIILGSMYHVAREKRRNSKVLGRLKYINMSKIALRLIVLFGIPEGIGLIFIPEASIPSNGFYINIICGFFYSTIKGLRGITFLLLYVCKWSVFELYKARCGFSKKGSMDKDQVVESKECSKSGSLSL